MSATHRVIIVGGGPAGLAAAYRLRDAGCRVDVVEQAPVFGGLARTLSWPSRACPGLTWKADIGVHRLHSATAPEVLDDLRALLGDDLLERPRRGLIFLEGRQLRYPLSLGGLVRGMSPATAFRCAADAFRASLRKDGREPRSYDEAVARRFGTTLNRIFYAPYAEKVWGRPPEELSAIQATKRITTRGFGSLLLKAMGGRTPKFYYYPRRGYGQMAEALETALRSHGTCRLRPGTRVAFVEAAGNRTRRIGLVGPDGGTEELDFDYLLWTGSFESLAAAVRGAPAPAPQTSLEWRAGHILHVCLDTPSVGEADAYYFPTTDVPFNRVSDQKKFSPDMVPPDKTVLCLDFTDREGTRRSAEELFAAARPHLESHGLLRATVLDIHAVSASFVYPIYRIGYEKDVRAQREWAGHFDNLLLLGRQGLFLHNNIHHSLFMGYRAADHVVAGGDAHAWREAIEGFDSYQVED